MKIKDELVTLGEGWVSIDPTPSTALARQVNPFCRDIHSSDHSGFYRPQVQTIIKFNPDMTKILEYFYQCDSYRL